MKAPWLQPLFAPDEEQAEYEERWRAYVESVEREYLGPLTDVEEAAYVIGGWHAVIAVRSGAS